MNSPVFIVGANRSGTTLMRLILNAHAHIAIPEELLYFNSYIAGIPVTSWKSPDISDTVFAGFVRDYVTTACSLLGLSNAAQLIEHLCAQKPYDLRAPYQLVLESWAALQGKARWGEKTPGNLFYIDIMIEMFPDARFIYMVRDPRAGVHSMMKTSFFPQDVVFNALSRHKFMTSGYEMLRLHVPSSHRMIVRYEDLVEATEATVRTVCQFLDEPFDPRMLQFHEKAAQYMKKEAVNSYNKAATRPISSEHMAAWRAHLRGAEIAQIQSICKREMETHGYPLDAAEMGFKQRFEVILKKAYWRYQEWRHRDIRHFTVKAPMFARLKGRVRDGLLRSAKMKA